TRPPHPTPPTPTGAPRLSGPNMIARTTPASRPSPSRGGLRPAWTPTPHTRTSTHARKTRKTAPAHPNQDLTGPAPFMDDQHHQDEKCPMWHWFYLMHPMMLLWFVKG